MLSKKCLFPTVAALSLIVSSGYLLAADAKPSKEQRVPKDNLNVPYEQDQTDVYAIPYDTSEYEEEIETSQYEEAYQKKHSQQK